MDKLRALQYFIAAAEEGSLSGAARRLNVSVPSVAKLVTSLERDLGTRLVDRTTHGLTLTTKGESYLEACRPHVEGLMMADEAASEAMNRPKGELVVAAPTLLSRLCIVPALSGFHAQYPDVQIEMRLMDRLTVTDLEAQGLDVLVALGWPGNVDLVQRRLAQNRLLVCASPDYWAKHGIPQRPSELRSHSCLLVRSPEGTVLDLWRYRRRGETEEVALRGWFIGESRDAVLEAVLCGGGVARFTDLPILPHLQAERLQPVLLDWDTTEAPPVSALFRQRARHIPRVQVFVEFLAKLLQRVEGECRERLGERISAERPYWYARRHGRASSGPRDRSDAPPASI